MWWLSSTEQDRVSVLAWAWMGLGYEVFRASFPLLQLPPVETLDLGENVE